MQTPSPLHHHVKKSWQQKRIAPIFWMLSYKKHRDFCQCVLMRKCLNVQLRPGVPTDVTSTPGFAWENQPAPAAPAAPATSSGLPPALVDQICSSLLSLLFCSVVPEQQQPQHSQPMTCSRQFISPPPPPSSPHLLLLPASPSSRSFNQSSHCSLPVHSSG